MSTYRSDLRTFRRLTRSRNVSESSEFACSRSESCSSSNSRKNVTSTQHFTSLADSRSQLDVSCCDTVKRKKRRKNFHEFSLVKHKRLVKRRLDEKKKLEKKLIKSKLNDDRIPVVLLTRVDDQNRCDPQPKFAKEAKIKLEKKEKKEGNVERRINRLEKKESNLENIIDKNGEKVNNEKEKVEPKVNKKEQKDSKVNTEGQQQKCLSLEELKIPANIDPKIFKQSPVVKINKIETESLLTLCAKRLQTLVTKERRENKSDSEVVNCESNKLNERLTNKLEKSVDHNKCTKNQFVNNGQIKDVNIFLEKCNRLPEKLIKDKSTCTVVVKKSKELDSDKNQSKSFVTSNKRFSHSFVDQSHDKYSSDTDLVGNKTKNTTSTFQICNDINIHHSCENLKINSKNLYRSKEKLVVLVTNENDKKHSKVSVDSDSDKKSLLLSLKESSEQQSDLSLKNNKIVKNIEENSLKLKRNLVSEDTEECNENQIEQNRRNVRINIDKEDRIEAIINHSNSTDLAKATVESSQLKSKEKLPGKLDKNWTSRVFNKNSRKPISRKNSISNHKTEDDKNLIKQNQRSTRNNDEKDKNTENIIKDIDNSSFILVKNSVENSHVKCQEKLSEKLDKNLTVFNKISRKPRSRSNSISNDNLVSDEKLTQQNRKSTRNNDDKNKNSLIVKTSVVSSQVKSQEKISEKLCTDSTSTVFDKNCKKSRTTGNSVNINDAEDDTNLVTQNRWVISNDYKNTENTIKDTDNSSYILVKTSVESFQKSSTEELSEKLHIMAASQSHDIKYVRPKRTVTNTDNNETIESNTEQNKGIISSNLKEKHHSFIKDIDFDASVKITIIDSQIQTNEKIPQKLDNQKFTDKFVKPRKDLSSKINDELAESRIKFNKKDSKYDSDGEKLTEIVVKSNGVSIETCNKNSLFQANEKLSQKVDKNLISKKCTEKFERSKKELFNKHSDELVENQIDLNKTNIKHNRDMKKIIETVVENTDSHESNNKDSEEQINKKLFEKIDGNLKCEKSIKKLGRPRKNLSSKSKNELIETHTEPNRRSARHDSDKEKLTETTMKNIDSVKITVEDFQVQTNEKHLKILDKNLISEKSTEKVLRPTLDLTSIGNNQLVESQIEPNRIDMSHIRDMEKNTENVVESTDSNVSIKTDNKDCQHQVNENPFEKIDGNLKCEKSIKKLGRPKKDLSSKSKNQTRIQLNRRSTRHDNNKEKVTENIIKSSNVLDKTTVKDFQVHVELSKTFNDTSTSKKSIENQEISSKNLVNNKPDENIKKPSEECDPIAIYDNDMKMVNAIVAKSVDSINLVQFNTEDSQVQINNEFSEIINKNSTCEKFTEKQEISSKNVVNNKCNDESIENSYEQNGISSINKTIMKSTDTISIVQFSAEDTMVQLNENIEKTDDSISLNQNSVEHSLVESKDKFFEISNINSVSENFPKKRGRPRKSVLFNKLCLDRTSIIRKRGRPRKYHFVTIKNNTGSIQNNFVKNIKKQTKNVDTVNIVSNKPTFLSVERQDTINENGEKLNELTDNNLECLTNVNEQKNTNIETDRASSSVYKNLTEYSQQRPKRIIRKKSFEIYREPVKINKVISTDKSVEKTKKLSEHSKIKLNVVSKRPRRLSERGGSGIEKLDLNEFKTQLGLCKRKRRKSLNDIKIPVDKSREYFRIDSEFYNENEMISMHSDIHPRSSMIESPKKIDKSFEHYCSYTEEVMVKRKDGIDQDTQKVQVESSKRVTRNSLSDKQERVIENLTTNDVTESEDQSDEKEIKRISKKRYSENLNLDSLDCVDKDNMLLDEKLNNKENSKTQIEINTKITRTSPLKREKCSKNVDNNADSTQSVIEDTNEKHVEISINNVEIFSKNILNKNKILCKSSLDQSDEIWNENLSEENSENQTNFLNDEIKSLKETVENNIRLQKNSTNTNMDSCNEHHILHQAINDKKVSTQEIINEDLVSKIVNSDLMNVHNSSTVTGDKHINQLGEENNIVNPVSHDFKVKHFIKNADSNDIKTCSKKLNETENSTNVVENCDTNIPDLLNTSYEPLVDELIVEDHLQFLDNLTSESNDIYSESINEIKKMLDNESVSKQENETVCEKANEDGSNLLQNLINDHLNSHLNIDQFTPNQVLCNSTQKFVDVQHFDFNTTMNIVESIPIPNNGNFESSLKHVGDESDDTKSGDGPQYTAIDETTAKLSKFNIIEQLKKKCTENLDKKRVTALEHQCNEFNDTTTSSYPNIEAEATNENANASPAQSDSTVPSTDSCVGNGTESEENYPDSLSDADSDNLQDRLNRIESSQQDNADSGIETTNEKYSSKIHVKRTRKSFLDMGQDIQCTNCDEKFISNRELKKHTKLHHMQNFVLKITRNESNQRVTQILKHPDAKGQSAVEQVQKIIKEDDKNTTDDVKDVKLQINSPNSSHLDGSTSTRIEAPKFKRRPGRPRKYPIFTESELINKHNSMATNSGSNDNKSTFPVIAPEDILFEPVESISLDRISNKKVSLKSIRRIRNHIKTQESDEVLKVTEETTKINNEPSKVIDKLSKIIDEPSKTVDEQLKIIDEMTKIIKQKSETTEKRIKSLLVQTDMETIKKRARAYSMDDSTQDSDVVQPEKRRKLSEGHLTLEDDLNFIPLSIREPQLCTKYNINKELVVRLNKIDDSVSGTNDFDELKEGEVVATAETEVQKPKKAMPKIICDEITTTDSEPLKAILRLNLRNKFERNNNKAMATVNAEAAVNTCLTTNETGSTSDTTVPQGTTVAAVSDSQGTKGTLGETVASTSSKLIDDNDFFDLLDEFNINIVSDSQELLASTPKQQQQQQAVDKAEYSDAGPKTKLMVINNVLTPIVGEPMPQASIVSNQLVQPQPQLKLQPQQLQLQSQQPQLQLQQQQHPQQLPQQFCILFIPDNIYSNEAGTSKEATRTATIVNFQPVPDNEMANQSLIFTPTTPSKIFNDDVNRSFICSTCNQVKELMCRLEANVGMTEEDKSPIKCPYCSNHFQSLFYLEYHLMQEHLKCENEKQCRNAGFNSLKIPAHEAASEFEFYITFALKCRSCHDIFNTVSHLNDHVMKKHKTLVRLQPVLMSPTKGILATYPTKNGSAMPLLQCPSDCVCRMGIRSSDSPQQRQLMIKRCPYAMRRLEKIEPAAYEVYTCTLCMSTFLMKDEVVDHLMKMHEVSCKFPCYTCLTSFRSLPMQENHRCNETKLQDLDKLLNIAILPSNVVNAESKNAGKYLTNSSADETSPVKTMSPSKMTSSPPKNSTKRKYVKAMKALSEFLKFVPEEKKAKVTDDEERVRNRKYRECPRCEKGFMYRKHLQDHIIYEHILVSQGDESFKKAAVELVQLIHTGETGTNKAQELVKTLDIYMDDSKMSLAGNVEKSIEDGEMVYVCCLRCSKRFTPPQLLDTPEGEERPLQFENSQILCEICRRGPRPRGRPSRVNGTPKVIPKPFSCRHCTEAFETAVELKIHKRTHSKYTVANRSFICTMCKKSFISARMLEKHMKRHRDSVPESPSTSQSQQKSGHQEVTGVATLSSNQTFSDSTNKGESDANGSVNADTTAGSKESESSQLFNCSFCEEVCSNTVTLKNHVKRAHGRRASICQFCNHLLIDTSEVRHMLDFHIVPSKLTPRRTTIKGNISQCDENSSMQDEVDELMRVLGAQRLQSLVVYHDFEGKCSNAAMRCPSCPELFATRESCRFHYIWVHDETCFLCDEIFKSGTSACQHKVSTHTSTSSYLWCIQRLVTAIVDTLNLDPDQPSYVLYQTLMARLESRDFDNGIHNQSIIVVGQCGETVSNIETTSTTERFLEEVVLSEDQLPDSGNIIEVVIGKEDSEDDLLSMLNLSPNYESCEQHKLPNAGAVPPDLEFDEESTTNSVPTTPVPTPTPFSSSAIAIPTTPTSQSMTSSSGLPTAITASPASSESYVPSGVCKYKTDSGEEQLLLVVADDDLVTYRDDIGSLAERISATCDLLTLAEITEMLKVYFENVNNASAGVAAAAAASSCTS